MAPPRSGTHLLQALLASRPGFYPRGTFLLRFRHRVMDGREHWPSDILTNRLCNRPIVINLRIVMNSEVKLLNNCAARYQRAPLFTLRKIHAPLLGAYYRWKLTVLCTASALDAGGSENNCRRLRPFYKLLNRWRRVSCPLIIGPLFETRVA